jgi:sulfoxide reductase heme-binding subunit YedZ
MAGRPPNVAALGQRHFGRVRLASLAASVAPGLILAVEASTGGLGVNPLKHLLHVTGETALLMLLGALALSPLRRVGAALSRLLRAQHGRRETDWNWLIRLRRQTGLFAFFYGTVHLAIYGALDLAWDPQALKDDLLEHPYIQWGLLALVIMLPLAATSTNAAVRWLGPLWKRLHYFAHAAGVLALLHFWMQTKVTAEPPWAEALAMSLLELHLAWSLISRRMRRAAPAAPTARPAMPLPVPAWERPPAAKPHPSPAQAPREPVAADR